MTTYYKIGYDQNSGFLVLYSGVMTDSGDVSWTYVRRGWFYRGLEDIAMAHGWIEYNG